MIKPRFLASLCLNRDRELSWAAVFCLWAFAPNIALSVSSWAMAVKMLALINKMRAVNNKIHKTPAWISPSSFSFPPHLPSTVEVDLLNLSPLPEPTSGRPELHTRSFSSPFIQSVESSQEKTLCWPSNQEAVSRWAPCPCVLQLKDCYSTSGSVNFILLQGENNFICSLWWKSFLKST